MISPQTAYIMTDILAGNTEPEDEPVLGRVGRSPTAAAPATGRLQDGHDERQPRRPRLRLRRSAQGPEGTGDRRRRLDGQQRQLARTRTPSRSARRRRSGRGSLTEVTKGTPIATFRQPKGLSTAIGRRVHRLQARVRSPRRRSRSCSSPARSRPRPTTSIGRSRSTRRAASSGRTAASGRRRRSARSTTARSMRAAPTGSARTTTGCSGQPAGRAGAAGRRAPTPRTSTARGSSRSARAGAGSSPRPPSARSRRRRCSRRRATTRSGCSARRRTRATRRRARRPASRRRARSPDGRPARRVNRAGRSPRRQSLMIVAPSPPSPRSPGRVEARAGGRPPGPARRRGAPPCRGRG